MATPLQTLNINEHTIERLAGCNIESVEDLREFIKKRGARWETELIKTPYLGRKSIEDIKSGLCNIELKQRSDLIGALPEGMTLRDYFAAQTQPEGELGITAAEAITGLKAPDHDKYKDKADFWVESIRFWAIAHAKYKYMQADAMLKAREAA